jgi:hypothetical protein
MHAMLYLGHFSFTTAPTDEDGPSHGVFTCCADAEGVDAALEKLRALVLRLKEEDDTLDDVSEVYLDSCVEVRTMPEAGMMSYWIKWPHEETSSISTGLRWAGDDEAVGYSVLPDDDDHDHGEDHADHVHGDDEADDDEGYEVEPFVEF